MKYVISSYREETRGDQTKWNNWERERQMPESITSVESKNGYKWVSLPKANRSTDWETYDYQNGKVAGVGVVISWYRSIFACQNWCGFCCLVAQSCLTLCNPMACSLPGQRMSMGFSRQEYWSGLPFPSPGDLPNPGIEPRSPESLLHCSWILLPLSERRSHRTGAAGL